MATTVSSTSVICSHRKQILKENILEHLSRHTIEFFKLTSMNLQTQSCLNNILDFLEELNDSLDEGKAYERIDFDKALDKVPHRKLAAKLKSCGIVFAGEM